MSIYIPGGTDKVSEFNIFFNDAYRAMSPYYVQAQKDLLAYAGDNWTNAEKTQLIRQRRMVLELNKVRRIINLYSGYERENRTSTVIFPQEQNDQVTADQFSEVMLAVYNKAQSEYIFSEAFEHSLKTGLAIVGMYLDYTNDKVNGDLKFYWKPFNSIILDPYFTKRDLSDCDQAATRDLLGRNRVKALLPHVPAEIIDDLPTGIRDNKFQYLGNYRQFNSQYISKHLLTYDQHWVRETIEEKFVVDQETGESELVTGTPEEVRELKQLLIENPQFKMISAYKETVNLRIIVGGQLLYDGPDPTGLDTYPFLPVLAYHEPEIDSFELKIQGVVRSVRDAQRQYNRRHSQIIDIMESIINSGWVHKNGAVVDPEMLFQTGQGRNIVVNQDFDVNGDLREISPPQIPQGYLAYQDIMDRNIMEIPGGSDELLGLSSTGDVQVSGKLAEVRASNGLKGNRGLFDNFEYFQKLFGGLTMKGIQKNFTPGKVQRLINQEPTEEFFSKSFEQFDCVIKSIAKTQTQREAYYYQLLQLRSIGVPIPDDELISAVPLQGKTNLIKKMAEMEEQKKAAIEQEMKDKSLQDQLIASTTDQNLALAQERRARVLSDLGLARERVSEAHLNQTKGLLNNAKTIAEMEDMKQGRFIEMLKLASEVQVNTADVEEQLDNDMERSRQMIDQAGILNQQQAPPPGMEQGPQNMGGLNG